MLARTAALILLAALLVSPGPVGGAGPYPEAKSWSPTGSGVPLGVSVVIEWTMRMDALSIQDAFHVTDGATTWGSSSFTFTHTPTAPYRTIAAPKFTLRSLTTYDVTVEPTALEATRTYPLDQNRNGTGGEPTDALRFSFTTEDADPPRVLWTSPARDATNVSIAARVTLGFSEAMTPETSQAFSLEPPAVGTFRWSGSSKDLTFTPTLTLAHGTTYAVRVRAAGAHDLAGNPLDGNGDGVGGDDFAFSFTTEPDVDPPTVRAVAPVPGSLDVSVTANVEIRFSETMNRTSVEASFSYTDGTTTWNGSAGRFSWRGTAAADDTVRFNPHVNLPFSRAIRVALNASVARDPAGFGLDGDGDGSSEGSPRDDVSWTFTTEAADTTPPAIAATDPARDATNVTTSTRIRLTFTEAMVRASVEDAFLLKDDVRTWTKANGTFAWETGDEEVAFTPSTTLAFKRLYTVRVDPAAHDVNGNGLDGNGDGVPGDAFTTTFETAPQPDTTPPRVLSWTPTGTEPVGLRPLIVLTFDDAMNRTATEGAISLASVDDRTGEETAVPLSGFEWSSADATVSFRPLEPLAWDTLHRVSVSQGARDDARLALERPFTFSFRTVAWRGPVYGRVVDASGGVDAATVSLGDRTIQTTASGDFSFPSVTAGRYNLTVEKPGYVTAQVVVDVGPEIATAEGVDLGTIVLSPADGLAAFVTIGVLGGLLASIALAGLWIRRRRSPPWERFDAMDEEPGGGER